MSVEQLDLFGVEAPADAPPRWVAELTAVEVAYRTRLLAERGVLARVMRTLERSPLGAVVILELWRWVMSLRTAQGLAANTTAARYVEIAARFVGWCQEAELDYRYLRPRDIETWQKALYIERKNASSWRNTQLQALRSLYDWRHRMALGPRCTDGVRSIRPSIRTPRKYTSQQLRDLFAAVKTRAHSALLEQRDTTLLLFLYATGARREEAGQLRLDQIELAKKSGTVRFAGKGNKERMISFDGPLVDALRAWMMARDHHDGISDALFWSTDQGHGNYGQALSGSGIERIVKRYAKAAGLGSWGVHRFRVTYATELYDAGTDIERIRVALGHKSIETTRRYLAVSAKQTSTRLPARNQYQALGMAHPGQPGWSKLQEGTL